jgi:hypothetical protein
MLVGAAFCEQQQNYWHEKYEGMGKRDERESYVKELTDTLLRNICISFAVDY